MKKIKVSIKINNYIIKTKGCINDNILFCNDNDVEKTEIVFDINNKKLIRDNKNQKIEIDFSNRMVKYILKEEQKTFIDNFVLINEYIQKEQIKIVYKINNNLYNLEIIYK